VKELGNVPIRGWERSGGVVKGRSSCGRFCLFNMMLGRETVILCLFPPHPTPVSISLFAISLLLF